MKPAHLLITVVLAVAALSVTAWLGKASVPEVKTGAPAPSPVSAAELDERSTPFAIAKSGPYGKAVATETSFDFGTVEKGDTGSHTFIIKNEGPGALQVKPGRTSCPQCTIGAVSPANEDIPPGGTAEVLVKWDIKAGASKFRQTADVHTNDPNSQKLVFAITGIVDTPLHLTPSDTWQMGDMAENEPTLVEGVLYSLILDDIDIARAECANPLVTVTWEKATASDLAEKSGKSGVKVKVAVAPGSAIGPFRETVKLHTTARKGTVVEFTLIGKRSGPIEFKGRGFYPEKNVFNVGEFPAAEGKKTKLQMYVRNFDGDLDIQQVESENHRVKVSAPSAPRTFGKSKIYDLEVEILPGPPAVRIERNPEPILLKLNHPMASEIKLYVDYYAK